MPVEVPDPQQNVPLFPSRLAFMVQFTRDAIAEESASCRGRVEHVITGNSARFANYDELLTFISDVLKGGESQSTAAGGTTPDMGGR